MSSHNWHPITSSEDITDAVMLSNTTDVLIYKHSNRCGICSTAKRRLEAIDTNTLPIYMVDVMSDRPLSMEIAERFGVRHESPQAILLRNGDVVAVRSHLSIRSEEFLSP